jgi:hypothetical protein
MAEGIVTYIYPAWGLVPSLEQAKKRGAVHARIAFPDEATLPVDIVHNLQLPYGVPLQPPEWLEPMVLVNALTPGPPHVLAIKDGNTISIGRAAGGPGTAVTYDVWVFRPHLDGHGWFD